MGKLRDLAARPPDGNGGFMLENPVFAQRLAELQIQILALEYAELRTLAAVSTSKAPGTESSILKMVGTEAAQHLDEMSMQLAASQSLPYVPEQLEDVLSCTP